MHGVRHSIHAIDICPQMIRIFSSEAEHVRQVPSADPNLVGWRWRPDPLVVRFPQATASQLRRGLAWPARQGAWAATWMPRRSLPVQVRDTGRGHRQFATTPRHPRVISADPRAPLGGSGGARWRPCRPWLSVVDVCAAPHPGPPPLIRARSRGWKHEASPYIRLASAFGVRAISDAARTPSFEHSAARS